MRIAALLLALTAVPAAAEPLPADPLKSPMWEIVADQAFGAGAKVRFDARVKLAFPPIAENPRVFPVQVDARGIPGEHVAPKGVPEPEVMIAGVLDRQRPLMLIRDFAAFGARETRAGRGVVKIIAGYHQFHAARAALAATLRAVPGAAAATAMH